MFEYIKRGWLGQLSFTQIAFGKYLGGLEGVIIAIAYIAFYVLLLLAFKSYSLQNIWVYVFVVYGVGFYIWLLRAFWGSAQQAKTKTRATLIRLFTILLPLISIILFVLILVYSLLTAIIYLFRN